MIYVMLIGFNMITLRSLIDGGCGIVRVDGNISKTNNGGGGVGWKKLEILLARGGGGGEGWLLNCFFLSFSNHENYSVKNICAYSKSKIKTKVTSKQNLEHFKKINRRSFLNHFYLVHNSKNRKIIILS